LGKFEPPVTASAKTIVKTVAKTLFASSTILTFGDDEIVKEKSDHDPYQHTGDHNKYLPAGPPSLYDWIRYI
jgi:hypothetical protein